MKFSLLAALFVSAVSIAAPVDGTDAAALARSVSDADANGPASALAVRGSLEPRHVNYGTPGLVGVLDTIYTEVFPQIIPSVESQGVAGFVEKTHLFLQYLFPDHNVFMFHNFQENPRFEWGTSNPDDREVAEVEFKSGFATEYYWIVVFRSDGYLRIHGDGGFENWIFSGVFTRDGDLVTFHER